MADLPRIKRNVRKMVGMGAPETDIDAYIASEGVTLDQVRSASESSAQVPPSDPSPALPADRQLSSEENAKLVFDEQFGSIPLIGGIVNRVGDFGEALDKRFAGDVGSISEGMKQAQRERFERRQARPGIATAANIAGSVTGMAAPMMAAPKLFGMAKGVPMGTRMATAAGTEGVIGAADTGIRELAETGTVSPLKAAIGGGLGVAGGALGPVADKVIDAGGRVVRNKIIDPVMKAVDPDKAAARMTSRAIREDRAVEEGLSPQEMHLAGINQQPVIAADMGGARTQNLARAATNIDAGAENIIRRANQMRTGEKGGRLRGYLARLTGDKLDDQATIESLKATARKENKTAYDKAYSHKNANAMLPASWDSLKESPAFIKAIKTADSALKNKRRAARRGSLEWWDQVSRNLRDQSEKAGRSGAIEKAADIRGLRSTLLDDLDAAIPAFKEARTGAFKAFGAQDAVEAGGKFAKTRGSFNKMRAAYRKLKPADRKLFEIGYASQLKDSALENPTSVLKRLNNDAGRKQAVMVFGKQRANELRSFIKVENVMEQFNRAQGNSTTARQLIQAGALGAGGGGLTLAAGGDTQTAAMIGVALGAGRLGAKHINAKVQTRYMKQVADMLVSDDPAILTRLENLASQSTAYENALDAISTGFAMTARGAVRETSRDEPLEVYLNADEREQYINRQ